MRTLASIGRRIMMVRLVLGIRKVFGITADWNGQQLRAALRYVSAEARGHGTGEWMADAVPRLGVSQLFDMHCATAATIGGRRFERTSPDHTRRYQEFLARIEPRVQQAGSMYAILVVGLVAGQLEFPEYDALVRMLRGTSSLITVDLERANKWLMRIRRVDTRQVFL